MENRKLAVKIKLLTQKDYSLLIPLFQSRGKIDSNAKILKRLHTLSEQNSHFLPIAVTKGKIIGYAWVQSYGEHVRTGDITARLNDLFVLPEYRNQGVATKLFVAVKKWCKSQKVRWLQWQASTEVQQFYEKFGLKGDTKSDLEKYPFFEITFF